MTGEFKSDHFYPIIDSHVHVYPSSELHTIDWIPATSPLHCEQSVNEYTAATNPVSHSLIGFIFVEVDRKNELPLDAEDNTNRWQMPLQEVDWARRIVLGTPLPGEGHSSEQRKLCLAIIPWAPIPSGEDVLEQYLTEVKKTAGDSFSKIRGFRYLVHKKPRGVMLEENFVKALKFLGKKRFVFDLGIDQHRRGKWQLEEAVQMIERVHDGVEAKDKLCVIINHLCKPNLSIYNQSDPSFIAWRTNIFKLSRFSNIYMKLSGCFSEMSVALGAASVQEIFLALQPYLAVILATFGASRIMFGSDWPVCTVGIPDAWNKWRLVVQMFCSLANLSSEDQMMIWSGTAIKAYGLESIVVS